MTAFTLGLYASSRRETSISYVGNVTSRNTGTRRFWKMGLTVVGNPAATVMTSSPGLSRRSPSFGEVNALRATRLAEEPDLTREADRHPTNRASLRSKSLAKRPVVNQPSSAASTTEQTSSGPITLPDTGTVEVPETNSRCGKASAWYSAVSAKICFRNWSARSLIDHRILKATMTNEKCLHCLFSI